MAVIEAIATTYLEADAASVTFSSLGSYEHLQIRGGAHTDAAGAGYNAFHIRFNGDTAANYAFHYMRGYNGSNTAATAATGYSYIFCGLEPGPGGLSTAYGTAIIDILDYRNTNKNTTISYSPAIATGAGGSTEVQFGSGLWDSTAAVTSIVLTPQSGNFTRGSEFTLFGLASS
jgi:hypothetical protein